MTQQGSLFRTKPEADAAMRSRIALPPLSAVQVSTILRKIVEDARQGLYVPVAGIGARDTPSPILTLMTASFARLADVGVTVRSGGARGADQACAKAVPTDLAEIFLPEARFERSTSTLHPGGDVTPELWARAERIARHYHPKWARLKTEFSEALMTRNSFQVLGLTLDDPSRATICWTETGSAVGGTGQAIRISWSHDVPVINLRIAEHVRAICLELNIHASPALMAGTIPLDRVR